MKKGSLMVLTGLLLLCLLFGGCGETSAKPAAVYGFCPSLGVVQGSRDGNFYYLETPQSAKGGGYQLLLANSDYNDTARELCYDTDALLSEDDVYLDYSGTFQLDAISEELPFQVE